MRNKAALNNQQFFTIYVINLVVLGRSTVKLTYNLNQNKNSIYFVKKDWDIFTAPEWAKFIALRMQAYIICIVLLTFLRYVVSGFYCL